MLECRKMLDYISLESEHTNARHRGGPSVALP